MAKYIGDTDQKRLARFTGYTQVAMVRARLQCRGGTAIGLIGNDAADVPLMRFAGFTDSQIILTDINETAVRTARERYPTVTAVNEDVLALVDAIRSVRSSGCQGSRGITLLCLDLMGHVHGWSKRTLELWGRTAAPGSSALVTVLGARETSKNAYWRCVSRDSARASKKHDGNRSRRIQAVSRCLPGFYAAGVISYNSGRSPMLMVHMVKASERRVKRAGLDFGSFKVNKGFVLRDTALSLCERYPSNTVAGLLNIPHGRVAAWKAHKTMGTYG